MVGWEDLWFSWRTTVIIVSMIWFTHSKSERRNLKPEIRNPKPESRDPRPETLNPRPEILNPGPVVLVANDCHHRLHDLVQNMNLKP